MPQIKTVVNKVNEIDNTYRNFQFEVLAGTSDTNVTCKENGCEFKFDFAKVYWNPRLGTEHERVVNLLERDDVLYDVFAGVGPFSVPAVSKRGLSAVLSNDLNPESYRYLVENFTRNTKSKTKRREQDIRRALVQKSKRATEPVLSVKLFDPLQEFLSFNLDGREFITTKIKYHLVEILNYRCLNEMVEVMERSKFYALMNLPAMSIEFLDAFRALYTPDEAEIIKKTLPADILDRFRLNVYCYHFCKGEEIELDKLKNLIRLDIFDDAEIEIESKYVRKVAPNKNMYCSMFKIGFKHFFMPKMSNVSNGGIKHKIEEIVEGFYVRENKVQKKE